MVLSFAALAAVLSLAAAVFAFLSFLHGWTANRRGTIIDQLPGTLREEGDRIRLFAEEQNRGLRQELAGHLAAGVQAVGERTSAIGLKLDQEITRMGLEAQQNRDGLRTAIEAALGQYGTQQRERLENVTTALAALADQQNKSLESVRKSVEDRLDAIRVESAAKLEEMRKTVDEKLQSTLETRLGESFNRVVEHLERVHKGIGEVQSLAAGVGDLKRVLSNVKVRGTYGEIQLGTLLEQFLSAEQIVQNAAVKEGSLERVEFAIRLPGREAEGDVLLPVDSKFPQEDYDRLTAAQEIGDGDKVAEAARALETRIKTCAKTIREKYVHPPRTTNFAILFLPTESLYAEALRRPGLFEQLQREFQVTLTGPTTFTALLNALQMGFRTLAIEKRSSEVWKILGAVQSEFSKYNEVVDALSRQLTTAAKSVEKLGTRTRAMTRTLRDVERLPDAAAQTLLPNLDLFGGDEDLTDPAEAESASLP
jgi:DNA recombination protein RmuC